MRKFLTRFFISLPTFILMGLADDAVELLLIAFCLISIGLASGFFALEDKK